MDKSRHTSARELKKQLTDSAADQEFPEWSPDGTKIAFYRKGGDDTYDIYVMDADGTSQRRLTDSAAIDVWPQWSPLR